LLTLLINLWAFRIELRNVTTNAAVIEGVMKEVDRIRAERGLASNDEALREDEMIANVRRGGESEFHQVPQGIGVPHPRAWRRNLHERRNARIRPCHRRRPKRPRPASLGSQLAAL